MSDGRFHRENDSRVTFYAALGLAITLLGGSILAAGYFMTVLVRGPEVNADAGAAANAQANRQETIAR